MNDPGTRRDPPTEFLTALGDELPRHPSESCARHQIAAAASIAGLLHAGRKARTAQRAATALATSLMLSAGGVAIAGGLPEPIQGMVADAACMLPVPSPIPHPAAPSIAPMSWDFESVGTKTVTETVGSPGGEAAHSMYMPPASAAAQGRARSQRALLLPLFLAKAPPRRRL